MKTADIRKRRKQMKKVNVIGAGFAGSEAAYQLAKRGVKVTLYEMKPKKRPPHIHQILFVSCAVQTLSGPKGLGMPSVF